MNDRTDEQMDEARQELAARDEEIKEQADADYTEQSRDEWRRNILSSPANAEAYRRMMSGLPPEDGMVSDGDGGWVFQEEDGHE